jgi:predicted alpha/beta-fold hydrolase
MYLPLIDAKSSRHIESIRRPVLYLNAADDPFAPVEGIPIDKYGYIRLACQLVCMFESSDAVDFVFFSFLV